MINNTSARADVAIVGGGIVGAATAMSLRQLEPTVDVVIVEPDPTYELAATTRASGGVRRLFSRPENILLAQHTLDVIHRWPDVVGVPGEPPPDLAWRPHGYLFVAGPTEVDALAANVEMQRRHGVRVEWLEPSDVGARYPVLAWRDLGGAALSPDDGWLDPYAFLQGLLRKAGSLGARVLRDRVVGFEVDRSRVRAARLESGGVVTAESFVNAAGVWAADLAAGIGMRLPVEPMRRFEHFVETPADVAGLPFIKDAAGLAIRPEGPGLSVGLVDFDHPGGHDSDLDRGYFEASVWPALVERIPALDRLRLRSTTVGHYDQNRLDGNLIIGSWPGRLDNFYVACGFSGHGLMQAPGVGRALAELVVYGEYRTIDLGRLGYRRVLDGQPYAERGIR
jgi:FAD-dependent oxidoreductase domain-containing protein 1